MRLSRSIKIMLATGFLTGILSGGKAFAKARRPEPGKAEETYNLTEGKAVPIPARKTALPLIIYGETPGQSATYIPSGYMGDASSIHLISANFSAPLSSGTGTNALKLIYKPKGRSEWVGIYWLTPANNWGKIKGAGYNLTAAKRLTFWARGEKGDEEISQVKLGGLIGPYPDTDFASMGPIKLTREWQMYTIDLSNKDLRHIVGGFSFTIKRSANPHGAIIYLDEIMYQTAAPTDVVAQENTTVKSGVVVTQSTAAANVAPAKDEAPMPDFIPAAAKPVQKTPERESNELDQMTTVVVPFSNAKEVFGGSNPELEEAVSAAKRYSAARILIEGHTDNTGPTAVNDQLSYQRAKAVADYLESKGVAKDRMSVNGYGSRYPVSPDANRTESGRVKNRRVEVILVPNWK